MRQGIPCQLTISAYAPLERIAAVQKHAEIADFVEVTPTASIAAGSHGGRAKCLQRLVRLDFPIPKTVALTFHAVRKIATGEAIAVEKLLAPFPDGTLLSVRPSAESADWGGPTAVLNIGVNSARHSELVQSHGKAAADEIFRRFIRTLAVEAHGADPGAFTELDRVEDCLLTFEEETGEAFPDDRAAQLIAIMAAMGKAWDATSARLLRQAKGAPEDAGLGLVVQAMALGLGPEESGTGIVQFIDPKTGKAEITGAYRRQAQGRDALRPGSKTLALTKDAAGASLEEDCPEVFSKLRYFGDVARIRLREEMQIEFTVEAGQLAILDAIKADRTARANVRVAVSLVNSGVIPKDEAVLRVPPHGLIDLLHRQVDETAPRDRFAKGIAASPGAATGRIVFSSTAAQASAAREEPCVLVRRETTPEDIRGMHASVAVLTERGGMTSHAAVIARGLGLPCVVGASGLRIDRAARTVIGDDGRIWREGDTVTIDGSQGEALAGESELLEPVLDDAFQTLLGWADAARDIGVRANADTPSDAMTARAFKAEGLGLCRTEHMFFENDRMNVMREMIFARTAEDRSQVLRRLMPMQRADFIALFDAMRGQPVSIRLFDPPLHEFLPVGAHGLKELSDALDLPLDVVTRRVEALAEFNPMLGMRGVRLGITTPEIYDVQARAIFEATAKASEAGAPVVPEVMIPLVSAKREVELVKSRIDAMADAVREETGTDFDYRLGVMVETPRACLRADEIAQHADFLSFGTNDLTQMTYGLSRDDAGRFMGTYVQKGVFPEDPFHRLDLEGVGELLRIAAERGRASKGGVTLALCGEHGGDIEAIAFCRHFGFDYVSCSPFRVPVARLAAAHLAIIDRRQAPELDPIT
ncbi:MAG: putative PEP-binding protein [Pseudomonadota bacterium]